MSITTIEMLTDAYRLANIIDQEETPSAEQGASGLRTLNQMMGQWHRDGLEMGWQVVTSQSATLPLDFQDERAVKYNLAVELAGEEGIEPMPRVTRIADETLAALRKAHRKQVECDMTHLPGVVRYADINTG